MFGDDLHNEKKLIVLFVEKPNAQIKVLDSLFEKDTFTKEDVKKYLKTKGYDVPNTDNEIILTPYINNLLTWQVTWDSKDGNGVYTSYRYKFDIKSGKVVEECRLPNNMVNSN